MITRAKLQEKTLDELRTIAASLEVPDHETLQKSKLIAAIVESDGFEASDEPAPVDLPDRRAPGAPRRTGIHGEAVRRRAIGFGRRRTRTPTIGPTEDPPTGSPATVAARRASERQRPGSGQGQGRTAARDAAATGVGRQPSAAGLRRVGAGGPRGHPRHPPRVVRLPAGRPEYLPGDKDVYVSASQVRKFGLRKGDILIGPIRPPRSQEKFPALIRIDSVSGMTRRGRPQAPQVRRPDPAVPRRAAPPRRSTASPITCWPGSST